LDPVREAEPELAAQGATRRRRVARGSDGAARDGGGCSHPSSMLFATFSPFLAAVFLLRAYPLGLRVAVPHGGISSPATGLLLLEDRHGKQRNKILTKPN